MTITLSNPENITTLALGNGNGGWHGTVNNDLLAYFPNVTTIPNGGFSRVYAEHIDLSVWNNLTTIGTDVFSNIPNLISLNLGSNNITSNGQFVLNGYPDTLRTVNLGNVIWTSADRLFGPIGTATSIVGRQIDTLSLRLRTTYGATTGSYLKRFFGATAFSTALDFLPPITTINATFEATTMPQYAFYGMYTTQTINIPLTTTVLGANGLENCTILTTHELPTSATTIPTAYMKGCTSMTTLTVPANYTTISAEAFSNMTSMEEYTFQATTPPTLSNSNAFENIPATCVIKVPSANLAAYQAATNWSVYASQMVGY
jgi:hypothetical protein